MGIVPTLFLVFVLLAIIWFIQQTLQYAAYKFYPLVLVGLLIAAVFWLNDPRQATSYFIDAGRYLEWVWTSTARESCYRGLSWFCSTYR